jgi:hypothetical protein
MHCRLSGLTHLPFSQYKDKTISMQILPGTEDPFSSLSATLRLLAGKPSPLIGASTHVRVITPGSGTRGKPHIPPESRVKDFQVFLPRQLTRPEAAQVIRGKLRVEQRVS